MTVNFNSSNSTEMMLLRQEIMAEAVTQVFEMSNAEQAFKEKVSDLKQSLRDRIKELSSSLQIQVPWLNRSVPIQEAIPLYQARKTQVLEIRDSTRGNAILEYEDQRDYNLLPAFEKLKEINRLYEQRSEIRKHPEIQESLKSVHRFIQEYLKYAEDHSHILDLSQERRAERTHSWATAIISRFHAPNIDKIVKIQNCFRAHQQKKQELLSKLQSLNGEIAHFKKLEHEFGTLDEELEQLESEELAVPVADGFTFMSIEEALDNYTARFNFAMSQPDPFTLLHEIDRDFRDIFPLFERYNDLLQKMENLNLDMANSEKVIQQGFNELSQKYSRLPSWKDSDFCDLYAQACENYQETFNIYNDF